MKLPMTLPPFTTKKTRILLGHQPNYLMVKSLGFHPLYHIIFLAFSFNFKGNDHYFEGRIPIKTHGKKFRTFLGHSVERAL